MAIAETRIYLCVPAGEREAVKALGARYDPDMRRWFVPRFVSVDAFARWLPAPAVIERRDGTTSTATANLVVAQVLPYGDPFNRTTWATRRAKRGPR